MRFRYVWLAVLLLLSSSTPGDPPKSLFFAMDRDRPAIGVSYFFSWDRERDIANLRLLKDRVDYVTVDLLATRDVLPDGSVLVRENRRPPPWSNESRWNASYESSCLEEVGIPWIAVVQGLLEWGIPDWFPKKYPEEMEIGVAGYRPHKNVSSVSKYAKHAWRIQRATIQAAVEHVGNARNLIGWSSGAEPVVFGWWNSYNPNGTGMSALTLRQFREWLAQIFGDTSPGRDTSGDGLTLNKRCGARFSSWADITANTLVKNNELRSFHDRFLADLTADYIQRTARIFRRADPTRPTVPRLLPLIWRSHRAHHLLSNYALGDAVGFSHYPVRKVGDDPKDFGFDAQRQRVTIDGVKRPSIFLHPPFPRSGVSFIDFDVHIDDVPAPSLHFFTGQRAPPENKSDGIVFRVFVGRKMVFEYWHRAYGWEEFRVPLEAWRGKDVRIRLQTDPGPARNFGSDWAYWGNPKIISAKRRISLYHEYYHARLGRSLFEGRVRFIETRRPDSDPYSNDFAFALMAGHARVTGKRIALPETNPTGIADAVSLWSLMHQVFRACAYKPAAITFMCYRGDPRSRDEKFNLAGHIDEIHRVRCLLALLRPFRAIKREPELAVFLPDFLSRTMVPGHDPRGANTSLKEAVAKLGMNVHPLSDIRCARTYAGVVVVLGSHDRNIGDSVADFLDGPHKGRTLILQCETPLRGFPGVSQKLTSFVQQARKTWKRTRLPKEGRDIDAFVSAPGRAYIPGLPTEGLEALFRAWFDRRQKNLSWGAFHIVETPERVGQEGLYLIECARSCPLADQLLAYDLLNGRRVEKLKGPGLFHVFEAGIPKLLDTGMMLLTERNPQNVGEISGASHPAENSRQWRLHVEIWTGEPARNSLVIYAPDQIDSITLKGEQIAVKPLGDDFYRIDIPQSGSLRIRLGAG